MVEPIHNEVPPVILTVGRAVTTMLIVSEHEVVEYIYLYVPTAALVKVTEAVPPPNKFRVAPAGLPVWAAHVPVVGAVPAIFTVDPAHPDWSTPALGLFVAAIVNESLQPNESVTTTL